MTLIAGRRGDAPPGQLRAGAAALLDRQGAGPARDCLTGEGIAVAADPGAVLRDPDGRFLIAADARLDDRASLAATLGASSSASDPDLILAAWLRWGEDAVQHLYGDYAFAVWDGIARSLTLVRDALGQRPLFFISDGSAFASRANAFAIFNARYGRPDAEGVAAHLAFVSDRPQTCYRGVERVMPGEIVQVTGAGIIRSRWWRPSTRPVHRRRAALLADYRDLLERAVADRISDAGPTLAAHLTAGLDSSTAVAIAAGQRQAGIRAYTAVPATTAAGDHLVDEGDLAARAAASLPGVTHHRVSNSGDPLELLAAAARIYQQPLPNPHNHVWVAAINDAARAAGARVLLIGQTGNYSFSMPGTPFPRLRALARSALRRGGPSQPPALIGAAPRDLFDSDPVPRGGAERRLHFLARLDPAAFFRGTKLHWGIEPRDPFAARALVEHALTIPELTLSRFGDRGVARPLAATLLPRDIAQNRRRGYQSADWTARLRESGPEIAALIDRARDHRLLADLLDLTALSAAAAALPDAADGDRLYRFDLPNALAVIAFVAALEDGAAE